MTIQNLENYIKDDLGIPYVNLEGMDIGIAYEIADALTRSLVIFPSLAYTICSIGSGKYIEEQLNMIASAECPRKTKWHDFFSDEIHNMTTIFERLIRIVNPKTKYVAISFHNEIYDCNLEELNKKTKEDSENGWHPKSCTDFKTAIYHEIGHILFHVLDLDLDKDIILRGLINKYIKDEESIKEYVSEYATTSYNELIAEIMSCYMVDPNANELINKVGKYIEDKYHRYEYDNRFNINYRYKRHKEKAQKILELKYNKEK